MGEKWIEREVIGMREERYISVKQSLIDSCREVKAMREGKQEEHTWDELAAYMDSLVAAEQGGAYACHLDNALPTGY